MRTLFALALYLTAAPALALQPGETMPPGNYHQTCQNCDYEGGVLQCACRRINQTWNSTVLYYRRQCPGDTLQNIDGVLRCD